mmetsp:Transcript_14403/g.32069  ORF Transcript_14403/g.32069 Transcript_14403/m.32069 type:complete len:243 (+) Transcript_14403:242-970(+)
MNIDLLYKPRGVLIDQFLPRMFGLVEHSKVHQKRMVACQVTFIICSYSRFVQNTFLVHHVMQHAHKITLRLYLIVATFLSIIFMPPIAAWLIKRGNSGKCDAPVPRGMLPNLCQVMSLSSEHLSFQIVMCGNAETQIEGIGIVTSPASSVVVFQHPPHRRIAEEFKSVCTTSPCLLEHGDLRRINCPIPVGRICWVFRLRIVVSHLVRCIYPETFNHTGVECMLISIPRTSHHGLTFLVWCV